MNGNPPCDDWKQGVGLEWEGGLITVHDRASLIILNHAS